MIALRNSSQCLWGYVYRFCVSLCLASRAEQR